MEASLLGVNKSNPFFLKKWTILMLFTYSLGAAFNGETLVHPHTAAVLSRVGWWPALKSQHPTPTGPKRACWLVHLHNKSLHECGVTPPRVHLHATPPTVGRSFAAGSWGHANFPAEMYCFDLLKSSLIQRTEWPFPQKKTYNWYWVSMVVFGCLGNALQ